MDVWIDTDPSIGMTGRDADDGLALIQAFHSPELHIRGLSATYGNAPLADTLTIARDLAERFGRSAGVGKEAVFSGAASAGGLGLPTAATTALAAALEERPLTYLALGPLTDLATLLKLRPELAGRIERVVFLGGRAPGEHFHLGNRLPYEFHDANFDKDPLAALGVIHSPVNIELVPLSACRDTLFTPADLARIGQQGGTAGRFLEENTRGWLRSWRWLFGLDGGPAFDCLAVLAVAHPEEFSRTPMDVCVSDRLEAVHPAAIGNSSQGFFLLVDDGSHSSGPGRKVSYVSAPGTKAKSEIIDAVIGSTAGPAPSPPAPSR